MSSARVAWCLRYAPAPNRHLSAAESSSHSGVIGVELEQPLPLVGGKPHRNIATCRRCGQPLASSGRIPRCRTVPPLRPAALGVTGNIANALDREPDPIRS
jgi:hypothetical protein